MMILLSIVKAACEEAKTLCQICADARFVRGFKRKHFVIRGDVMARYCQAGLSIKRFRLWFLLAC